MHLKSVFCLLLISVLVVTTSFSQKSKSKTRSKVSDDKDVEVIDFGNGKNNENSKTIYTYDHAIIKTNPFLIGFGKGLVEYEREINEYMSIQFGVGATFQGAIPQDALDEIFESYNSYCESDQWPEDVCDNYSDVDYHKQGLGFLVSVQPKFYFDSDGFEGWYIAPVAKYSSNPYKARSIEETRNSLIYNNDFDVSERVGYTDLTARIGAQSLFPKLTSEFFLGGGLRLQNADRQDIGRDNNFVYRNGKRNIKDSSFIFEFGLRFGFQL